MTKPHDQAPGRCSPRHLETLIQLSKQQGSYTTLRFRVSGFPSLHPSRFAQVVTNEVCLSTSDPCSRSYNDGAIAIGVYLLSASGTMVSSATEDLYSSV